LPKKILITNDDGWDAPGLAALRRLGARLGEVYVVAPREPQSYSGHRVTTADPLVLSETAPREFTLSGTPADCVRVALSALFPDIDWVLAGINRGGNLGADLFTSGTVAAAREAALLGRPAIAVSQYIRKGVALDWNCSREMALPVVEQLMSEPWAPKRYWNVNLPHLEPGSVGLGLAAETVYCEPDNEPLQVRFQREGDRFHYSGSYPSRPRTPGRDVDLCFGGAITISCLDL
jgi:5'-nucleotidase